jgi:type IV pilus assembly protein PilV
MQNERHITHQAGSVLLEGLFAILIFSMGILSLVGLQSVAVKQSTDAKYRAEASLVANELIGKMWVSDRSPDTLKTNFETGGGEFNKWKTGVTSTLPGITASANQPTVVIDSVSGTVTVTVLWQAPGESQAHNYTVVAQIK